MVRIYQQFSVTSHNEGRFCKTALKKQSIPNSLKKLKQLVFDSKAHPKQKKGEYTQSQFVIPTCLSVNYA